MERDVDRRSCDRKFLYGNIGDDAQEFQETQKVGEKIFRKVRELRESRSQSNDELFVQVVPSPRTTVTALSFNG